MSFKVGDIAVYVHTNTYHEYAGTECEIVSELIPYGNFMIHLTRAMDGRVFHTDPRNLRKKPPKKKRRQRTTTWDRCIWKPAGVSA